MTWADVVALAPALSTVGATRQTQILAEVGREVDGDAWGDLAVDGALYLAAHKGTVTLLSLAGSGAGASVGPVTSESLGPMSRSYGALSSGSSSIDPDLARTSYGLEYARLRRLAIGFGAFVA